MLTLLKKQLLKLVDDLDAGNTHLEEDEVIKLCDFVSELTRQDTRMSKYKAYTYLNVSRATFDNYVAQGLLPKGKKEAGYKELSWYKKDLDECAAKIKAKKAQKDKM
ncbi:MAG: hypothetical protein U0L26_06485 [Cellulosilyticum sp.]|nr:hypothetical protein [Cellulosilyticum sp.]